MKYWEMLSEGENVLKNAGVAEYRVDAYALMEHATGLRKTEYYMRKSDTVDPDHAAEFKRLIDERATGRPVQYIIGSTYFMGLRFEVNENVLIPRFDTEVLVETLIKGVPRISNIRILDMCTGSGCIGISLAWNIVGSEVTCVDYYAGALEVARKNAEINDVSVTFIESDLFDKVEGDFHVIVANPPYIRSGEIKELMREVRKFEPLSALDGSEDGLEFYRRICADAGEYLVENGMLFFEIGFDQREDVEKIMKDAGFSDIVCVKDLAGLDRVIWGRYC